MPQERLPKQQALHAKANGRRPVGRPRTRWIDYNEDLEWNRLGLCPSEMMEVRKAVRCGGLILSYCPRNPHGKAGNEERRSRFFKKLYSIGNNRVYLYAGAQIKKSLLQP